ncbi:MAG: DUF4118 domain-containing protein [Clostridiales bacterium]|nr:DUF4118 domain-containing protein [Clostridiales bacterium]
MKEKRARCAAALRDILISVSIMALATVLGFMLQKVEPTDAYVSMIFVLAVFLISRLTSAYLYGIAASFLSVICVNYVFTYPYFELNFSISGYPLTFLVMLAVSVVTSAMTTQIKQQESVRAEAEKEKMRGNLLRAISHDLRTPLTGISGAATAILEQKGQMPWPQEQELLHDISEDSQWLIRMVENLLSITRISSGETKLVKREEAAEEVIAAALMAFRKRYPQMKVNVSAPDELLMVPMDAILIRQVLVNLLENAAQHGGENVTIDLSVRREGENAVFSILDNGRGIPAVDLPHLFDGSLKVSHSVDASRGMGIGLSVCVTIVKAHGGAVHAENNKTGGALFYFTLPLTEEPVCQSKM